MPAWPTANNWPSVNAWPAANNWPSGTSWPGYDWTTDTQMLGRWEAGSLADLANGPFGALIATGGAITTTPNALDGNPVWSMTKVGGVRLVSTNLLPAPFFTPWTVIIVGRVMGTPTVGDRYFDPGNVGHCIYASATALNVSDGANNVIPGSSIGTYQATIWYSHGTADRVAVNNGAFNLITGGAGNLFGITLGAQRGGANPSDCDIAAVYVIEGQASAQLNAGLFAYLRAKFPSVFSSTAPQAQFSADLPSRGALPAGAFDIILVTGQSNNCCEADTATTAPAANTYFLPHGGPIKAMVPVYDAGSGNGGYQDSICSTATNLGGNGAALCNAYTAATGRNVLLIPSANGGSQLMLYGGENPQFAYNVWDPTYPRGRELRNSLYGSALARLKNAIALGGTFRFIWHYQGEAEALDGRPIAINNWASNTDRILRQLTSEAGVTHRAIIQTIADTVGFATAPSIATVQAQQASLASAGTVLVMPKNNNVGADNTHLNGTGCDQVGAAAAAAALAQTAGTGWY